MRTVFDQRVAYLVEHGGLWDDPTRELYRYSRTNRKPIAICIALTVVQILQVVWMR